MAVNKRISRRQFVKLSSLATAGLVASACGAGGDTAAVEEATTEDQTTSAASDAGSDAPVSPPGQYNEAPMLADLVAGGELPPVDERLPVNPSVVDSVEGIGNYGGTIRRGFKGVSDRWGPTKMQNEALTWYNPDLTVRANLAESWELNEDGSEWTFFLREGTKWSDGHPLDSDSYKWWYENQLLNETLTPSPPGNWSTGAPPVLMEMEFPDKTTIKMKFAHPNPLFIFKVTRNPGLGTELPPGHYMAQFHADLTDDPDKLAQQVTDAGFETWDQLYVDRRWWYLNPERPQGGPWVSKNQLSEELFLMERNPYFWQVDSAGNQLPYVDKVNHRLFETNDVFDLRITSGEIDFQNRHVNVGNFTLYKQNEEQGDYRVLVGSSAGHSAIQLNLTTKNERLREFFNKRDVRIALSVAANREEMNELIWDGLLTPRQYSPLNKSPQYYPKLSDAHIEFDQAKANDLLDGAGYTEKDSDGFRLWDDGSGEPISFVIEGTAQPGSQGEDEVQLVIKYFADVGIKASYKGFERSLYEEHWGANEIEAAWWGGDRTVLPIVAPWIFLGTMTDRPWAAAWGMWRDDGDTNPNSEEPPADHWIRDIWAIWDQIEVEPDSDKRNELFFQILDIWAEELPMVGYLGESPALIIAKNGMKGYVSGYPIDDTIEDEHLLSTQTYYWDDPDAHM